MKLVALATVSCFFASWCGAQDEAKNLELRFRGSSLVRGVPQAFTFELVNVSAKELRVPVPAIQCAYPQMGFIRIWVDFTPASAEIDGRATGQGCGGGVYDGPRVLERAKQWKILRPGESLKISASREQLLYDDRRVGTYKFWATYSPPAFSGDERAALRAAGILVPEGELTTTRIRFVKVR